MESKKPIGKCGDCGGLVTVHEGPWWGINPPVPSCERCGAVPDQHAHLPVLPMRHCQSPADFTSTNMGVQYRPLQSETHWATCCCGTN